MASIPLGVEVFYEDRDERPAVKYNDADLLGLPVRVVGERSLKEGRLEISLRRNKGERITTPFGEAVSKVLQLLVE